MVEYTTQIDNALEAQYNLVKRRGEASFGRLIDDWQKLSMRVREQAFARTDLAYGTEARQKLDFFYSGQPNGPALVYIHGGYWQGGDKSLYSFLGETFVKQGISLIVFNYPLAPSVRITAIAPQIQRALAWCYTQREVLLFDREQLHLSGHSAGGHLTAMMMTSDWPAFDVSLPSDLFRSALPISGVFDLQPLVHTSLNDKLGMDQAEAYQASPLFKQLRSNAPQLLLYGEGETDAFHQQSIRYVQQHNSADRLISTYQAPVVDHFDIIELLADDSSELFGKVYAHLNNKAIEV